MPRDRSRLEVDLFVESWSNRLVEIRHLTNSQLIQRDIQLTRNERGFVKCKLELRAICTMGQAACTANDLHSMSDVSHRLTRSLLAACDISLARGLLIKLKGSGLFLPGQEEMV